MRKALGKGLSQLLGDQLETQVMEALIDSISPNSRQPRRHFDADSLEELADSIRIHGVLAPIIVRPISDGKYEIIAGERRWRASKLAGLKNVPISVRSAAGQESLEIAIIENVQRADISAYESALAYQALISEFGLTQEEVALRVGKTRTAISNLLRLLKLPNSVLQELQLGKITEGHARALLAFGSEARQLEVLDQIKDEGLSVRDVERLSGPSEEKAVKKKKPVSPTRDPKDLHTKQLESAISEKLGTAARIDRTGDKGSIVLPFFDDEDLQRILDSLGVEL
jgi:ParB family transcriptional regulator, chromosome partitioning protein